LEEEEEAIVLDSARAVAKALERRLDPKRMNPLEQQIAPADS